MPKLIDYPRTNYTGAWELAEIVDDTGGKCAIETAARKLNRKVSGSFKAIIGSAVKFGLMTSKRELLTTTTLFRRIKHAYDKAEELQFHREAFLTPPLFTQLCRKFRNRELPVQMLDVMLIREFGVEEINAQNVAKSFVDGCKMSGLIDERNIIADIDAMSANRTPRREIANPTPILNAYETKNTAVPDDTPDKSINSTVTVTFSPNEANTMAQEPRLFSRPAASYAPSAKITSEQTVPASDAIANLFGFNEPNQNDATNIVTELLPSDPTPHKTIEPLPARLLPPPDVPVAAPHNSVQPANFGRSTITTNDLNSYQMQMSGPGVNTALDITDEADIAIAIALLEKIRRQLRSGN